MRTFIAPNEDFIKKEHTALLADASAGTNVTISVLDNNGIALNSYVVIGYEGAEQTEIAKVNSAVTLGSLIQVDKLLFAHKADAPVTVYRFNQRKFYGCVTPTGTFVELTAYGSPANIQADDPQGTLFEYSGPEGYTYFKSTYFNSTTSEETDIADSDAVAGDQSTRYTTIYNIKHQAGLTNNPYITDGVVETYRKRAESEVRSIIMFRYNLPLVEIPAIIENCCSLLAAGYMDYREFGRDGEGVKWLGEARGILNSIKKGAQRLLGADEQELPTITTANTVQGYPDGVDNKNGPIRMFTSKQRF